MAFLVFRLINDLKIAVEVGFVVGITPAITPSGSATILVPLVLSDLMMPQVFSDLYLYGYLLDQVSVSTKIVGSTLNVVLP